MQKQTDLMAIDINVIYFPIVAQLVGQIPIKIHTKEYLNPFAPPLGLYSLLFQHWGELRLREHRLRELRLREHRLREHRLREHRLRKLRLRT